MGSQTLGIGTVESKQLTHKTRKNESSDFAWNLEKELNEEEDE